MRAPFIDHVTIRVADLEQSRSFYAGALEPFGAHARGDRRGARSRAGDRPRGLRGPRPGRGRTPPPRSTSPSSRWTPRRVDAFHAAALEAGGRDNGEPGPRPQYHERYYAAYALDPDGNNIEAVCHTGPTAAEQDPARPR